MASVPRSSEKKRHYCSVCSNFRGQIVDGQSIVLHKFNTTENMDKTYKNSDEDFHFIANTCLCSTHFVNGRKTSQHNVPSVLPIHSKKKLIGTSSISESTDKPDHTEPNEIEMEIGESDETESRTLKLEMSLPYVSLHFHDYCGEYNYDQLSKLLDKCDQTIELVNEGNTIKEVIKRDTVTQTRLKTVSTLTQTELIDQHSNMVKKFDVGIQCKLPDIAFEDIADIDSAVMFYTGMPNAGTFHALFDEMDDAESQTARTGSGQKKRTSTRASSH